MKCNTPQALTIAGSDSGGGAGIQADLKTFQMRHVFGTSVITAVTAQNTLGVFDIHYIPIPTIEAQLKAISEDFNIQAFKVGMLGTEEIIKSISSCLKKYHLGTFVLDPVMIAKGGSPLLQQNAINALKQDLIPLADIITPNIPEAEALTGIKIVDDVTLKQAAIALQKLGVKTVIIKGGHQDHSQSHLCRDWIFMDNSHFILETPRIHTSQTHGTGCTFSACIVAELAKGQTILNAIKKAKVFITDAIQYPLNIGQGHGPTNHWAYKD